MTKRIIDGMTAEQIAKGWSNGTCQDDLVEYLESICKSEPSWGDDLSDDNPVLCWVSNEPIPESGGEPFKREIDYVFEIMKGGYIVSSGHCWKYARPISPDECWKPAKQGE